MLTGSWGFFPHCIINKNIELDNFKASFCLNFTPVSISVTALFAQEIPCIPGNSCPVPHPCPALFTFSPLLHNFSSMETAPEAPAWSRSLRALVSEMGAQHPAPGKRQSQLGGGEFFSKAQSLWLEKPQEGSRWDASCCMENKGFQLPGATGATWCRKWLRQRGQHPARDAAQGHQCGGAALLLPNWVRKQGAERCHRAPRHGLTQGRGKQVAGHRAPGLHPCCV